MALITMFTSKIIASNISPVKIFRKSLVWNLTSTRILLLELLGFLKSLFKLRSLTELLRLLLRSLGQVERMLRVGAVLTILFMMLLILAGVSFPSDVQVVDGLNQNVVNFTGNVAFVCIIPLVRLSLVDLLVHVSLFTKHQVHLVHW